jgi:RNA polymerase sigma factor (sigma-70 family)
MEGLFREHYRSLCAFALQYVKDADRAEDVLQDLFFRLWLDREKLTITTSIKAYLFAAVRNRCLTDVKVQGRVRSLAEERDDGVEEEGATKDEHTERIARVHAASINGQREYGEEGFAAARYRVVRAQGLTSPTSSPRPSPPLPWCAACHCRM